MCLEFNLAWWVYLLLLVMVVYLAGVFVFLRKGAGLKLALVWFLFFLIPFNVQ